MKTSCDLFVEEIAAFVGDAAELSAQAEAHVHDCATCRAKIAQLQEVAALHRESAAHLTEPNRRLTRTQLERALDDGQPRWSARKAGWRPVLAGALVLAVIVGLITFGVLVQVLHGG